MTGDVVEACVRRRRLFRPRLIDQDPLVLIAAVDVYVASALQVEACGVVAAPRDEELHGAHGPGRWARHVGAGGLIHAVRRVREVSPGRGARRRVRVRQAGCNRQTLLVRR